MKLKHKIEKLFMRQLKNPFKDNQRAEVMNEDK